MITSDFQCPGNIRKCLYTLSSRSILKQIGTQIDFAYSAIVRCQVSSNLVDPMTKAIQTGNLKLKDI